MSQTAEIHKVLDAQNTRFARDLVANAVEPALGEFRESTAAELKEVTGGLDKGRRDLEKSSAKLASLLSRRLDAIEEAVESRLHEDLQTQWQAFSKEAHEAMEVFAGRLDERSRDVEQQISDGIEGVEVVQAAGQGAIEERLSASQKSLEQQISDGIQSFEEMQTAGQGAIEERLSASQKSLEQQISDGIQGFEEMQAAGQGAIEERLSASQKSLEQQISGGIQSFEEMQAAGQGAIGERLSASQKSLEQQWQRDLEALRSATTEEASKRHAELSSTISGLEERLWSLERSLATGHASVQKVLSADVEAAKTGFAELRSWLEAVGTDLEGLQAVIARQHGQVVQRSEIFEGEIQGRIELQSRQLEERWADYRREMRNWLLAGFGVLGVLQLVLHFLPV